MVFGWGKKKSKPIPEDIPQHNGIQLAEVQKITQDLCDLRKNQTLTEIKSIRNHTSPLIKELAEIAKTLENDDLNVEDIDKNIRIIVVRGKKQVIDVIKKDSNDLPEISSFENVLEMNNILNQKLKKIGDVLGRQTRVIHIFAKKYAAKLKEILAQMNSNHKEIQKLITNFQDTISSSNKIIELLDKIKKLEDDSTLKNQLISESENMLISYDTKEKNYQQAIEKIKSSEKYNEFLKLTQKLSVFNNTKIEIKNEIDSQFTKISRALSRYEYASSLDKEQKLLLSQLINGPFMVLTPENKDYIIMIFENVKKGIHSGSISVKDTEKSISYLTETEELLDEFTKKIINFTQQKKEIQNQLSAFDDGELSTLQKELEKTSIQQQDIKSKISSNKNDIDENHTNIPKMIEEIESKLERFSHTSYSITLPS
jgi:chromosome segregation ATPase